MYLTFETFAKLWFPLLMSLGIYCLCDGLSLWCQSFGHKFYSYFSVILAQWKHFDKDKNTKRCSGVINMSFTYEFLNFRLCLSGLIIVLSCHVASKLSAVCENYIIWVMLMFTRLWYCSFRCCCCWCYFAFIIVFVDADVVSDAIDVAGVDVYKHKCW